MMETDIQPEVVYFLGIGGIGMSAIARYYHAQGKAVMGYDRTRTALTTELEMEGMDVHYDDTVLEIPQLVKLTARDKVLVVYTPAIPEESSQLNWFMDNGFTMMKRSQVLGLITRQSKTIAVAGTHGKTTTSSMIAHLLTHAGFGCNAFLGGITSNYKTNLLLSQDPDAWTVVEADEYDRSFLTLSPTISVITNVDADHLDIYGTHDEMLSGFNAFADKLLPGGHLLIRAGLPLQLDHWSDDRRHETYAMQDEANHRGFNTRIAHEKFFMDYAYGSEVWESIELGLPGKHNAENAVAAIAVARIVGLTEDQIRDGLRTFRGVKRRFEFYIRRSDLVLIDDYAHHPEELFACITAVRQLFPERHVTGVFQPHLFSRTRDFGDAFARSLELLDEIILLPIYPAREKPMPGIDSQWLLDKIQGRPKILVEKGDLLATLTQSPREVVVMLGAGDIDALVPLVSHAYGE
jgi:UDP-N-acetylmuramate--alanine ligase